MFRIGAIGSSPDTQKGDTGLPASNGQGRVRQGFARTGATLKVKDFEHLKSSWCGFRKTDKDVQESTESQLE